MILAIVGYLIWVSHGRERLRFQGRVQKTLDEIDRRIEARIALIRATRGLFMASDSVSREEFRDFVATLNLAQRYPSMQAMGFATAEGPDGAVVTFFEGVAARPRPADWKGDNALKRARDDGVPAASSPGEGTTFPVFAPVYRRGAPAANTEQRRAAITGYVFASMDLGRLLKDAIDPEDAEEIAFRIDAGAAPGAEPGEGWRDTRTITVAGQPWRVEFRTLPAFKAHSAGGPVLYFLFAGLAFSAALFAVSRAQVRARSAAERIASHHARSEEALRRSEDRGRRMIETALDAVISIDLEGRITAWNPKAVELFGWAASEAIGKVLAETIIPAEYKDAHIRGLATFRSTGHGPALNRRIEVTARRRDGTEFPVELAITPIGSGDQASFSAFVRDLTDRRRAESSLKESLERFRIAAGTTTDLIYEWSPATGHVRHLGRGPEEFPRTRAAWEEIVHPEDAGRFKPAGESGAYFGEYRVRRKDGSWRTWTDRAEAVRDKEGQLARWIGSIADVTDRRGLERDRERLLERLQMQMERMPVACILTGPDFAIRLWNPAASRVFGFARDQAIGRTFDELLLPPEARAEASRHLNSLAEGQHSSITTWENVTREGGRILCEWHAGPLLEADGSFAGLQAMAIDTTERARLEGQLRQAQKMEAIGRLAGGIAHDFNNLLTAVSGYGEILLDSLKPDDPSRTYVDEIRDAARRAADLTRQLLAFSRKQVLEPSVLDLNAVLADMDKMLRRVIGEDVTLVTALDPAVGHVKADRGQVEQVIMNLVVNARDAMPKGGRLTLETRNVELDPSYVKSHPEATPGPHVLLAVSDTGGGIPAEVLPRIFEPFFTTKERGKGTGLGLATVYGIVKQSGGHISAYSEPGRGAAFKVYLARVDGKVDARPAPGESRSAAGGTETILIVEDESPVRKLLAQILRRNGYTLIEAATGIDALAAASRHGGPIHLMVTDVVMPGMSGRDLARKMEPLRPDMKVLYISGYTENAIVHHGELDPGTAFLAKPFTPAALAQKVREVLG
jgi:PAS domain S-box-containing protein